MPQSLSKLYVHIIFHIKYTSVPIKEKDHDSLYAYMGSIIKDNDSIPILINGTNNHVHILCVMSKNIALAKLVEEIKRHSSRWIKTQDPIYKQFAWQGGYAGFSVSPSVYEKTNIYIKNQKQYHNKVSFQEETELFLSEYKVDFNETYLWKD